MARNLEQAEKRIAELEAEVDQWHRIVTECERVHRCPDTASSALNCNLPNLCRDDKSAIAELQAENKRLRKDLEARLRAARALGDNDDTEGAVAELAKDAARHVYMNGLLALQLQAKLDAAVAAVGTLRDACHGGLRVAEDYAPGQRTAITALRAALAATAFLATERVEAGMAAAEARRLSDRACAAATAHYSERPPLHIGGVNPEHAFWKEQDDRLCAESRRCAELATTAEARFAAAVRAATERPS